MHAFRESFFLRRFRMPRLPRWTAAECAIALLFATNGLLFGGWIVRIPAITSRLDITTGTFGLILPAGAIGAMIALPTAGKLAGLYGSARVLTVFSMACSIVVPAMILIPNPLWFAVGLFCYGFSNGAMDVALNAQGVEVERAGRRSILSSLHGYSSLGSLAGSLIGGIAAGCGVGVMPQLSVTCAVIGLLTLVLFRKLVPDEPHIAPSHTVSRRRLLFLPPRILLPFGAIAFCAVIGEGGMADWSTLYLRNELDVSASLAAFGYTTFALCMLIGRFGGDRIVRRFGEEWVIRAASVIAGSGLLFASGVGTLWAGFFGFAVAGLGLSVTIPMAYRMAGNTPGIPRAQAVASTALIAYIGFVVGPLVLGSIGDSVSIRLSIATIGLIVLGIQGFAHFLRTSPTRSTVTDFAPVTGTVTRDSPVT